MMMKSKENRRQEYQKQIKSKRSNQLAANRQENESKSLSMISSVPLNIESKPVTVTNKETVDNLADLIFTTRRASLEAVSSFAIAGPFSEILNKN